MRRRQPKRRNQTTTRAQQKPTVTADGSGDVFPRELPEGCTQSSSLTRVRTVGFGPRPRGATVGDWTSGTSSYPRKCSLTLLQDSNERRVSVPEGDEGSLRSTSLKTKTFGDNLRWAKETNRRSGAKGLRARPSALTFGRRR